MTLLKTIISKSLEDLPETAAAVIETLNHPLLLFKGQLGAGKTTLIKELLKQFGSVDAGSSPSYSLINEYNIDAEHKLYHLDLYRLNTPEEAFALGLEEIIYSGHRCMIEWPQLIMDYLEPPFHLIELQLTDAGHRELSVSELLSY